MRKTPDNAQQSAKSKTAAALAR